MMYRGLGWYWQGRNTHMKGGAVSAVDAHVDRQLISSPEQTALQAVR